ncbi:MAG: Asp-tRNA(Asn)/Glu-tRNA(Gln) amidotransferase subunit GatC [Pseudomonadota bacterium]|jgi:aspartyl-tRNA(Asn)/glutamyl-tRNA(Gln) amidotransferase subunit C|nr:Asp-tRNA(Asn)/Glu-tRNA(Gln) amidotransferase subunit GatC [Pseudomonadota bacterium]
MSLNREDVEKLCLLARLEVTPEEMTDVASKLSDIVTLVNQLQTADTTGAVPMAHPLDIVQRLREDKVTESDRHERYQQNAPMVEKDLYLVPKVIE